MTRRRHILILIVLKMKKFIPNKSTPTVAVSMPKSGNDGGLVTFLHEKAGSFSMACSLPKKKDYVDVKIHGSKVKPDVSIRNTNKSTAKSSPDPIEEHVEAGPSVSATHDLPTSFKTVPAKPQGSKSFQDDEEKMDKMHQEAKRLYTIQKKEELLRMDKEFETLNKDIGELIRKEKEEIRNMEGLMREVERRKAGCGTGKGKVKAVDENLEQ